MSNSQLLIGSASADIVDTDILLSPDMLSPDGDPGSDANSANLIDTSPSELAVQPLTIIDTLDDLSGAVFVADSSSSSPTATDATGSGVLSPQDTSGDATTASSGMPDVSDSIGAANLSSDSQFVGDVTSGGLQFKDVLVIDNNSEILVTSGDVSGDSFSSGDEATGNDYSSGSYDGWTYSYDSYSGSYSGSYSTSAGDINGDGFDDKIVYAYSYGSGAYTSTTYVVFGTVDDQAPLPDQSALDGNNGFLISSNSDDGYDPTVLAAGDINGDGFADLVVNSYGYGGSNSPYVILGRSGGFQASVDGTGLDGVNGFTIDMSALSSDDSWWVETPGDINGDGFADVQIEVWSYGTDGSYSDTVYTLFGSAAGFQGKIDLLSLQATVVSQGDGSDAGDGSDSGQSGDGGDSGSIIGIIDPLPPVNIYFLPLPPVSDDQIL